MFSMGEIRYVAGSTLKLDPEFGEKVFSLVMESSRRANEINKTYPSKGLEATLRDYNPEIIWDKFSPLIGSCFAFEGNRLVGTAFLLDQGCNDLPQGTGAYLGGLYIHPEYWNRNVASTLLDQIKNNAREKGIKIIRGYTTTYPQTMRFYEKHGFKLEELILWEALPDVKLEYYKMEFIFNSNH